MKHEGVPHNRIHGEGTSLEAWCASDCLALVPEILPVALVPGDRRLVIVAPHPDDEVLMCGGLLSILGLDKRNVLLVSVTDGEASHPNSQHWTPGLLRKHRPLESLAALKALGIRSETLTWLRLGLPDTGVPRMETRLSARLAKLLNPHDIVVTTWRGDGHCDHEATGRACASAVRATGAVLVEAPIWAWHWAAPDDSRIPWQYARKVKLEEEVLSRKRRAVQAHHSQIHPDKNSPPVLCKLTLDRLLQPFELIFI